MPTSINLNAQTSKTEIKSVTSTEGQASSRTEMNAAILQASLDVSISAGNEPLSLLYRTAIDSLNEVLKADLGENAIQNAMSQDNSPEGTAGRIVSLSTGFYEAYKLQHSGEDPAAVLENFMDTIRSGFEKGYQEAVDILKNLQVFEGNIAADIQKTYDLVLQGYADFESAQSATLSETA